MKSIYVLETGALILLLQDQCVQGDQANIERHNRQRRKLLHQLRPHKGPYAVPAYSYAEFLFGLPDKYKNYLSGLPASMFRVAPMSERVAILASSIKQQLVDERTFAEAAKHYGQTKNLLQIDIFILATSAAEGPNAILVTRDQLLKRHADNLHIKCIYIEDLPDPNDSLPESTSRSDENSGQGAMQMSIFDVLKDSINEALADGATAEVLLPDVDKVNPIAPVGINPVPTVSPLTEMQVTVDKLVRKRHTATTPEVDSKSEHEEPR